MVAVATIVDYLGALVSPDTPATPLPGVLAPAARLATFREDFYRCVKARTDALFELVDAVLCADGPVTSLVELSLTAEHPSRSRRPV